MIVAFLLSSGVSIPAGMPSTPDITGQVLSGRGIRRHTDTTYGFGEPLYAHAGFEDEYLPRVLRLLEILKAQVDEYYDYEPRHPANYEDLYFLARQICDSESGEYYNPAVQPLFDKIVSAMELFLVGKESVTGPGKKADGIGASRAGRYVQHQCAAVGRGPGIGSRYLQACATVTIIQCAQVNGSDRIRAGEDPVIAARALKTCCAKP